MPQCFQFNGSCENLKGIVRDNESFHLSDADEGLLLVAAAPEGSQSSGEQLWEGGEQEAVLCSRLREQQGKVKGRSWVRNSHLALVSVSSVWLRLWEYRPVGRFKKCFSVHSMNKLVIRKPRGWAGRWMWTVLLNSCRRDQINDTLWHLCSQRWYLSSQSQ